MRIRYLTILLAFVANFCAAEPPTQRQYLVEIPSVAGLDERDYFPRLLRLVLEASKAPDETIVIRFSGVTASQARWIAEVQKSQSNRVIWTVTSKEREAVLRPIRVPLFKGLLGYRQLVIRREDAAIFNALHSKAELAQLVAGQGSHWPDTDILKANQMPVIEGMTKENLYKMLVAKRFDYFPRGITEIAEETELIRKNNLMVAPHLLMFYPQPMYFFVNNQNTELARRLEEGIKLLVSNGEFDRLLEDFPNAQQALRELQRRDWSLIRLENPDLPEETPLRDKRFWPVFPEMQVSGSSESGV